MEEPDDLNVSALAKRLSEDSWCSWQKATNTLDVYQHKPPMRDDVFEAIKPIYERLTSDDLFTRCIGDYTQNNNESFNSTVWAMTPKTMNSGKVIVDIATSIASCVFNDGLRSVLHVFDVIGTKIGLNSFNVCTEIDANRIKKAEQSLSVGAKEARMELKAFQKEKEAEEIDTEGQLYGAGIAD